jgi:Domain of Unknown Function (DUF928)
MKRKSNSFLNLIPLLVFVETLSMLAGPQLARSQTDSATPLPTETQAFDAPPGDEGKPDNTAGGGSRSPGDCLSKDVAIMLTPISGDRTSSLSIAVPTTSARALVVKIEDENDNLLYYDTLAIANAPGTLNVHLQETASALEVGKQYKWTISAICGAALDPNDPTIEGLLTPISLTESSLAGIESVE